jgi:hypothetical protein
MDLKIGALTVLCHVHLSLQWKQGKRGDANELILARVSNMDVCVALE